MVLFDLLGAHLVVLMKVFTSFDEATLELVLFFPVGLVLEKLQQLLEAMSCHFLIHRQLREAFVKVRITLKGIVEF
jgi:hypothetical protein